MAESTTDRAGLIGRASAALRALEPSVSESSMLTFWVPGRIELLGKHTDYAGGRSLLCAVDRGFAIVAAPRADHVLRVVEVRSRDVVSAAIGPDLVPAVGHWSNYPFTVARRLARDFGGPLVGADVAFISNLPVAAGISSSSALVVGMFLALSAVNDLASRPEYSREITNQETLGGYLGAVENGLPFGGLSADRGVGTFGGSEDQTAILCSRPGELVQYSFCPVRFERAVPLPADHVFLIAASGVEAHKTGAALEAYNRAATLARIGFERWRRASGRSEETLGQMVASYGGDLGLVEHEIKAALERDRHVGGRRGDAFSPETLVERLLQFAVESDKLIPAAGDALMAGDLSQLGEVVDRSMTNAEEHLHNQTDETIFLARHARELGASAASAFGAGFGGSVWALVRRSGAEEIARRLAEGYGARFPELRGRAEFFLTDAGDPAGPIAAP